MQARALFPSYSTPLPSPNFARLPGAPSVITRPLRAGPALLSRAGSDDFVTIIASPLSNHREIE